MQHQWFVIHTLSGQEGKVKESIEKRIKTEEMGEYIKEVLVPMEKVAEVRSGKKTVSDPQIYPGYVFVDMMLLDDNKRIIEKPWYFIRETPGIIGFVGGDRPVPTSADEMESIKSQISEGEDHEKPKVALRSWRNGEDQRRAVPEFQRCDRGNRAGTRQVESDREHFRPQYAGGTGILAGGESII
jgi:transcription antitermination factor NusG